MKICLSVNTFQEFILYIAYIPEIIPKIFPYLNNYSYTVGFDALFSVNYLPTQTYLNFAHNCEKATVSPQKHRI